MELLSAKWDQVDLKRQTFKLYANITKTDAALVNLKEEGDHHFTLHDFRRTFRTLLSKLSVRRDVAEKCMNHSLKGVEKTDDCYGFFSFLHR
ncbi:hypothetical protein [Agaribacter flavus]|uniref:Uncharacterized protein n=1 Tax=Agaribacter flavus TaxID=1902781 RepID=A0ABV7FVM4_9ALTE